MQKTKTKMKKVSKALSIGFLFLVLVTACQQSKDKSDKMEEPMTVQDSTQVTYTCEMHPEEISHEPGKCSKCGMELVMKEGSDDGMKEMDSTKQ
jgi:Heavy metal binding domain